MSEIDRIFDLAFESIVGIGTKRAEINGIYVDYSLGVFPVQDREKFRVEVYDEANRLSGDYIVEMLVKINVIPRSVFAHDYNYFRKGEGYDQIIDNLNDYHFLLLHIWDLVPTYFPRAINNILSKKIKQGNISNPKLANLANLVFLMNLAHYARNISVEWYYLQLRIRNLEYIAKCYYVILNEIYRLGVRDTTAYTTGLEIITNIESIIVQAEDRLLKEPIKAEIEKPELVDYLSTIISTAVMTLMPKLISVVYTLISLFYQHDSIKKSREKIERYTKKIEEYKGYLAEITPLYEKELTEYDNNLAIITDKYNKLKNTEVTDIQIQEFEKLVWDKCFSKHKITSYGEEQTDWKNTINISSLFISSRVSLGEITEVKTDIEIPPPPEPYNDEEEGAAGTKPPPAKNDFLKYIFLGGLIISTISAEKS